jgi:hypothetical protein
MRSNRLIVFTIFAALTILLTSCVHPFVRSEPENPAPPDGYGSLGKFPFKDLWYGMYFQEDKVGFSHTKIEPEGRNFIVDSESVMRLTTRKKTNEIRMKQKVKVRRDLSMVSFESETKINDKTLKMTGTSQADTFLVEMIVDGERSPLQYSVNGKIYPTSAISLMPALRGVKEGQSYSFGVFNPEKQGIEKIEQTITSVKGSPGPKGAIWKVTNNFGKAVVSTWLNKQGKPVFEKQMDGQLIIVLEDESSAKQFLEKKTSTKDLMLDVSLVKVNTPIPNPEKLKQLKLKVSGVDPSLIAEDHRQKKTMDAKTDEGFTLTVTTEKLDSFKAAKSRTKADKVEGESDEYLAPSGAIQSNHPEIVAQSRKIVPDDCLPFEKVSRLVHWTAKNIASKMEDQFTALSVLRNREGECKAHANLYAAFARAQQIPTRVVIGLVYTDKLGFLYHAWAESYLDGWLAVDPTFDQIPADATHIRIAGDASEDEFSQLFKLVGKVKLEVKAYD